MNEISLAELYAILARVARQRSQITYGELSEAYLARTGQWFEPHGSWDQALGDRGRKAVRNLFLRFGWSGTVLGMGRPRRAAEGGYVYHVLNRANADEDLRR